MMIDVSDALVVIAVGVSIVSMLLTIRRSSGGTNIFEFIEQQSTSNAEMKKKVEGLERENAELREQNKRKDARIASLEAQIELLTQIQLSNAKSSERKKAVGRDDLEKQLKEDLVRGFSLSEMKELAFTLGIDWEKVEGENTTPGKAIALVEFMRRRSRLDDLRKAMEGKEGEVE